uniref:Calcium uniporter protein n=1 Tax=Ascaris lumbricoides TaxID=6252 RepID=A0A9J2Q1N5_ASCLU
MRYERGLPVISIPLPSRREICQFSLKPISDTVFNLCNYLAAEDKGIDFVALYTIEGTRIAGSTSIEHLLQLGDFKLRINDVTYELLCLVLQLVELSSERFRGFDDMKATVASLHAIFNVDEFKLDRERKLIEKLEEVELELKPLEAVGFLLFEVKARIDAECESHSERIMWTLFAAMGLQTDYGFIFRYNELQDLAEGIRKDLNRLRDPLYQHLPATHLAWALRESASKHRQRVVDASKNEKT